MSLTSEQLEELSGLLIRQFDDEGKELDKVVKYNLGSGLFVDYAGHGKFRNVVDELLKKTEQKGSTVKLFEGVMRVRPDNPEVKAIIARNFPQILLTAPETAKQVADVAIGVKAVRARLGIAAVHDLVVTSRNDLERLVGDLDLLARYKKLHDCLHTLQIQFLRLIDNAARKLETDPSASDALVVYLDQLQIQSIDAREAAEGLPDSPGERDEQMGWVLKLISIINGLSTAVMKRDGQAAIASVYKLKTILRGQPSHLDELILITARRTPIARLVETLQKVAEASKGDDGHSSDLTNGIAALQRFIPDQMGLVAQHSEWQRVADFLWQAEELLYQASPESLEGFQYVWQDLSSKVREIAASDPVADWAIELNQHARDFETAFPLPAKPPVPDAARLHFKYFLSEVTTRFYKVDKALHAQCNEMIKLGQPLQRLLEEVSDDSH